MAKPSGKNEVVNEFFSNTALNDNQFYQLAYHIDRKTRRKIQHGKFVDLAKLLKQSKKHNKKDNNLEILSKDGRSYFLPGSERDQIEINSFRHWEQVFRLYAGIFAQANPSRGHELFQHVNNIHAAAVSFVWDNVYQYDIEFKELMARNSSRNWGVVYHNGWMIKLKDHQVKRDQTAANESIPRNMQKEGKKDIYWKFNKNRCNFGQGCRFEHRCSKCGKMVHPAANCHKNDRNKNSDKKDKLNTGQQCTNFKMLLLLLI